MILNSIQKSIIKFVAGEVRSDLDTLGIQTEFIDWDTRADINELEDQSFIGPMGMMSVNEDQSILSSFGVGISLIDDTNLYRTREASDYLFDRLAPEKTIQILNGLTGDEIGFAVVTDGTMVSPVEKNTIRSFQIITCSTIYSKDS